MSKSQKNVLLRQSVKYSVGGNSPILLIDNMISKEQIAKLAEEALGEELFIVEVKVRSGNIIEIVIDSMKGVSIQQCIDVSRYVEDKLDRDAEDFELSVFSAGLGQPLKVYRQYEKNLGQEVEVNPKGEKPMKGVLKNVDPEGFDLEVTTIEKDEKKKKIEVTRIHRFNFSDEVEVKTIISFK